MPRDVDARHVLRPRLARSPSLLVTCREIDAALADLVNRAGAVPGIADVTTAPILGNVTGVERNPQT
jgi:hypothetical protein